MSTLEVERRTGETLLTDKEVAKLLKASVATVWRRVKDGTLPKPIKIGTLSRFLLSDIFGVIERAKTGRAA